MSCGAAAWAPHLTRGRGAGMEKPHAEQNELFSVYNLSPLMDSYLGHQPTVFFPAALWLSSSQTCCSLTSNPQHQTLPNHEGHILSHPILINTL